MKDKILLFAIGVLVGAIIATGGFYIYTKANCNSCNNEKMQMRNGERSPMNNGERPTMPNNENSEPPALPNNEN